MRRFFRFSLRTLVILVLFLGGCTVLWRNCAAWSVAWTHTDEHPGTGILCVTQSINGKNVIVAHADCTAIVSSKSGAQLRKIELRTLPGYESVCMYVDEVQLRDDTGLVVIRSNHEFFVWSRDGEFISRIELSGYAYPDWIQGDEYRVGVSREEQPELHRWFIIDGGKTLATFEADRIFRLWDTRTGAFKSAWAAPNLVDDYEIVDDDLIVLVDCYSPDRPRKAQLWSLLEMSLLHEIVTGASINCQISLLPGAHELLVSERNETETVSIWDVATGRRIANREFSTRLRHLQPLPDGRLLTYACDFDEHGPGTISIWTRQLQDAVVVSPRNGEEYFAAFRCSSDSTRIAAIASNTHVTVYDTWRGETVFSIPRPEVIVFDGPTPVPRFDFLRDSDGIIFEFSDDVTCWHRRRPEYWWGVAWLPEFWCVAVFGAGLIWSLWRDQRVLQPHMEITGHNG